MTRSSSEPVRRVRTLTLALVAVAGAACNDPTGLPDASAAGESTVARALAPSAAPSFDVAALPGFTASGELTAASVAGTVNVGGPWTLRAGPNFTYLSLGKIASGTAVTVVCTTNRFNAAGEVMPWNRLSTGPWIVGTVVTPNAAVPDCDSPAGPQVTAGTRGNDYPYKTDPADSCVHDAWGFCKRQCTSFVAWRLRNVNGIANFRYSAPGANWGNASTWAATAKTLGYRVDKTPTVGAVAQWNQSSSRPVGHVAWVAAVSADGRTVTIEEYNTRVYRGYSTTTVATSSVNNFLHLY